jgi:hypothetical protein
MTKSSETKAWWVLWNIDPFVAQDARSKKNNGKIFIKILFIFNVSGMMALP